MDHHWLNKRKDLIKLEAVYTLANYLSQKWFKRLLEKLK
jgi:hypothetical protein